MALFTLTSEKEICLLEKLKIPKIFISTAKNFQQQQHKIQIKNAKKKPASVNSQDLLAQFLIYIFTATDKL